MKTTQQRFKDWKETPERELIEPLRVSEFIERLERMPATARVLVKTEVSHLYDDVSETPTYEPRLSTESVGGYRVLIETPESGCVERAREYHEDLAEREKELALALEILGINTADYCDVIGQAKDWAAALKKEA